MEKFDGKPPPMSDVQLAILQKQSTSLKTQANNDDRTNHPLYDDSQRNDLIQDYEDSRMEKANIDVYSNKK